MLNYLVDRAYKSAIFDRESGPEVAINWPKIEFRRYSKIHAIKTLVCSGLGTGRVAGEGIKGSRLREPSEEIQKIGTLYAYVLLPIKDFSPFFLAMALQKMYYKKKDRIIILYCQHDISGWFCGLLAMADREINEQ